MASTFPLEVFLVVIPGPLTLVKVGLFVVLHITLIEVELTAVAVIVPSAGSTTTGGSGADPVDMTIEAVALPTKFPMVTASENVRLGLPATALLLPPARLIL